jgi:hypothetical protein
MISRNCTGRRNVASNFTNRPTRHKVRRGDYLVWFKLASQRTVLSTLHFPPLEGELAGEGFSGSKPSLAVVVRDVDVVLSEPNNIRTPVSRQVHDESRVLADSPSLLDTEAAEDELGRLERPVSVVVRDVDSCLAEPDDVSALVTGQVGDETRVLVDFPSLIDPKLLTTRLMEPKTPFPWFKETDTPALPKPTRSTLPSPVKSAMVRGC